MRTVGELERGVAYAHLLWRNSSSRMGPEYWTRYVEARTALKEALRDRPDASEVSS